MQEIQPFDPTTASSGTFDLPLPNGGWLVIMNESVIALKLTFGDGTTALINPFLIRAMRVQSRQTTCNWSAAYSITGGQAPSGLNIVTGEAYDSAEWDGGVFFKPLPRMVNVGNQTGSGTVADLVNDGNAPGTQIIESTATGSTGSNVRVTNDGDVDITVLDSGAYNSALHIAQGSVSTPKIVQLHGTADAASTVPASGVGSGSLPAGVTIPGGQVMGTVASATNATNATNASGATGVTMDSGGPTSNQFTGHISASNFSLLMLPQPAGVNQNFGVRVWDGAASHDVVLVNSNGVRTTGGSYFSGTGDATVSHGLGQTPSWVGVTCSQSNSTMTVGADTYTSSTVHVNTGGPYTWKGIAMA